MVSSDVNSKKSETVPIFQPFDSKRSYLACSISPLLLVSIVFTQALFANLNHIFGCCSRCFVKNFNNKNCILINSINDPPVFIRSPNP
jgi:hypothetical protein